MHLAYLHPSYFPEVQHCCLLSGLQPRVTARLGQEQKEGKGEEDAGGSRVHEVEELMKQAQHLGYPLKWLPKCEFNVQSGFPQ